MTTPHFEQHGTVRRFIHDGQAPAARRLELGVGAARELRLVLPLAANVGQALRECLACERFASGVGRVITGGASHLAYHRMIETGDAHKPYDYGAPVVLGGYVLLLSGALTLGRDLEGKLLVHCHAGFIDRTGQQHGGHLVLDRVVVGYEPLVLRLCLFDEVAYQVAADEETHFNLLHPTREAS